MKRSRRLLYAASALGSMAVFAVSVALADPTTTTQGKTTTETFAYTGSPESF
jgi:hypothetical protein